MQSVADLVTLTPGLTATTNGTEGTTIARIRGVGNVADNPGLEDAVGLYIDDVYRPRNGVSFNDLGELNDVEILKGPQGTLFGKNTIAGVIQITTKRPSFTFGAQAEATVANYGGYGGSISVTGPIVDDKVAIRLYVADRQRDGYRIGGAIARHAHPRPERRARLHHARPAAVPVQRKSRSELHRRLQPAA